MNVLKRRDLGLIVFDLDGVILDSEPMHEIARRKMFRKYSVLSTEGLPCPVGLATGEFWRLIKKQCPDLPDEEALVKEHYSLAEEIVYENHLKASEGLLNLLEKARESGIRIGLASSSTRSFVDAVLNYLSLYDKFDFTIAVDEVKNKKPDPEPYLRILERAGISAKDTFAVEDSESGICSAKAAGIYCFGYKNPTSGEQNLKNADKIISRLYELDVYVENGWF